MELVKDGYKRNKNVLVWLVWSFTKERKNIQTDTGLCCITTRTWLVLSPHFAASAFLEPPKREAIFYNCRAAGEKSWTRRRRPSSLFKDWEKQFWGTWIILKNQHELCDGILIMMSAEICKFLYRNNIFCCFLHTSHQQFKSCDTCSRVIVSGILSYLPAHCFIQMYLADWNTFQIRHARVDTVYKTLILPEEWDLLYN